MRRIFCFLIFVFSSAADANEKCALAPLVGSGPIARYEPMRELPAAEDLPAIVQEASRLTTALSARITSLSNGWIWAPIGDASERQVSPNPTQCRACEALLPPLREAEAALRGFEMDFEKIDADFVALAARMREAETLADQVPVNLRSFDQQVELRALVTARLALESAQRQMRIHREALEPYHSLLASAPAMLKAAAFGPAKTIDHETRAIIAALARGPFGPSSDSQKAIRAGPPASVKTWREKLVLGPLLLRLIRRGPN